jgi:hypothetical protein
MLVNFYLLANAFFSKHKPVGKKLEKLRIEIKLSRHKKATYFRWLVTQKGKIGDHDYSPAFLFPIKPPLPKSPYHKPMTGVIPTDNQIKFTRGSIVRTG